MESYLSPEALWASGLASRLRLVQANFADDQASTRRTYIIEEIERALKGVVPSKRKAYLDVLAEAFPIWQQTASGPAPASQPVGEVQETPEVLLQKLLAIAPQLSPETKAEFTRKLQQAGLAAAAAGGGLPELPPELQKKLGLPPGKQIDPERTLKMIVALSEFSLALDQLVWALWKQMAPKSTIRKEVEFSKLAGPYLAGDPEVSTQLLAQPLERTRKLIAGLLGAIGRAGSIYGKKHVARFAPEVIEDWAKIEKKWSESLELVCWRKYVQHAKEHATEPAIENEIQEAITKTAESLIMGRAAN
ncbi:MAG: hypothetical protein JWR26_2822 [Pedosphaera sp.]|nr:hypothetical protein [Pedosphaera sp.]